MPVPSGRAPGFATDVQAVQPTGERIPPTTYLRHLQERMALPAKRPTALPRQPAAAYARHLSVDPRLIPSLSNPPFPCLPVWAEFHKLGLVVKRYSL
jgi:hypothetical protein